MLNPPQHEVSPSPAANPSASPLPADPADVQPWLYKTTFTNPRPALEVERIEYVSKMGHCGPFLVAVTVE